MLLLIRPFLSETKRINNKEQNKAQFQRTLGPQIRKLTLWKRVQSMSETICLEV